MTVNLEKINKSNGNVFTQDDIAKIDNNTDKIQNAFNNLSTVSSTGSYNDLKDKPSPLPSGSIVTSSTTNGNIKIDGTETTVYTHPTGSTTTNPHGTTKSDVGLSNVDNTSDLNKPISTATQSALNNKADKSSVPTIIALTSAEYSAISSPNANTLYLIKV